MRGKVRGEALHSPRTATGAEARQTDRQVALYWALRPRVSANNMTAPAESSWRDPPQLLG
eukprot:COSAG06_NODE_2500_length_6755_cov_15.204327_1_plen_60_part_00